MPDVHTVANSGVLRGGVENYDKEEMAATCGPNLDRGRLRRVYRFYDLDLSGFALTSSFSVAFAANMSGSGPKLFIDDIELVR